MSNAIKVFSLVLFFMSHPIYAAIEPSDKKSLVAVHLEQSGQSDAAIAKQYTEILVKQMTPHLKNNGYEEGGRAYIILEEVIREAVDEEIVSKNIMLETMYPIYSKHLSVDELKQLIELYKTPINKHIIGVMSLIGQESMRAGQKFGESIGPVLNSKIQLQLQKRFKNEGVR